MDTVTLTAIVTALTPFITWGVKVGLDRLINFIFMFQTKLPKPARIILPIVIGIILQTVGSVITGATDPATGVALGAMAGGLGSSGRDLIHRTKNHS